MIFLAPDEVDLNAREMMMLLRGKRQRTDSPHNTGGSGAMRAYTGGPGQRYEPPFA